MKLRTLLAASAAALISSVLVAQGQVPGVNSTLQTVFTMVYEASTSKPTYSATSAFTPASAATDVCTLIGSSTKTIRVRRIIFSGITTSTVATDAISVIKRSTAATTGVSVVMTNVPYSSTSSSATAVAEYFTTNPTVGTVVGAVAESLYTFGLTTSVMANKELVFEFGRLASPVFLRGTGQNLAVSLNSNTVAGPVTCTFEWTEDTDS